MKFSYVVAAAALYLLYTNSQSATAGSGGNITLPNGQVLTPVLDKSLGNGQVSVPPEGNPTSMDMNSYVPAYTNTTTGQAVYANGDPITNWGVQPG